MKKILSLLLAVLMIVPLFTQISVFGANTEITLEQTKKIYPNIKHVDTYYYGDVSAYGNASKEYKCYRVSDCQYLFFKKQGGTELLVQDKAIVDALINTAMANFYEEDNSSLATALSSIDNWEEVVEGDTINKTVNYIGTLLSKVGGILTISKFAGLEMTAKELAKTVIEESLDEVASRCINLENIAANFQSALLVEFIKEMNKCAVNIEAIDSVTNILLDKNANKALKTTVATQRFREYADKLEYYNKMVLLLWPEYDKVRITPGKYLNNCIDSWFGGMLDGITDTKNRAEILKIYAEDAKKMEKLLNVAKKMSDYSGSPIEVLLQMRVGLGEVADFFPGLYAVSNVASEDSNYTSSIYNLLSNSALTVVKNAYNNTSASTSNNAVGSMTSSSSKNIYTTDEKVVITWTKATNATRYGLTVVNNATNEKVVNDSNFTGTSYTIDKKLPAGTYRFNMCGYNSNGNAGPVSAINEFTVKDANTSTSSYSTGTYKPSEWDGLNMRSGASTSYSKVGAIASGTNFVVTKISGNWGYTTCNGKSGWVCLDYATYVSSSTTTSSSNQIYSNIKLTDSNVDDYVGKKIVDIHNASVTTKITKNGKVSTVTHNPYVYDSYCDGGSKQCVDYAWGRIQDKLKFRPNWTSGHAKDIPSCAPDNRKITSASNTEYTVKVYTKDSGANIKADSLVCFGAVSGNAYGHVIYIEHVKEVNGTTYVYYTHGGVEYYNSGVTGTLYKKSLSDLMKTWGSYTGTVAFISDNNSTSNESEQDTNTKTPETNTPEYETITEGTYVLNCIIQSYRYLTAKTDSNGGQVEAKPFENIDAQKFDIVKSGNGYKIVSKNSSTGRAVSGYNDGSGQTIGNVTLANSSSSSSQIWLFRKEGDYYVIYPSFNTSLALTSASTGRVVVSTYTGNDDQLWKLSFQNEEPEEYTVTYNANGGSGAPKEQTKTAGEDLKLSSTEPTRNGYKFLGWATSKTGNVKFESGEKYTDDKNITLYAVWEEIKTYTIKYNANGGAGAPSSQTKTHGESIKVSSQKPTRSGYEFDGWATSANGNVEYDPSENYTKDSDITLYAVWKPLTYKVTYNVNGGTGAPAAQAKIHNEKLYITDDTPERDGYSFVGWATTKTGSVSYKAGQQYTSDKDITLYAVWEANTYTISYNANGGSGAPKNQTKKYAESIKLSTQEPTRKNYIFLGWSTSAQGSVEFAPGSVCSVNENITLYALWQEEENEVYYIIYNANGGKNAPSMQTKNEDEDITISEVAPTREGYTFDGWAIGNDDTVVYSSGDTYKENKTLYLHAVWTANTYTISYNANGGVGAPRNQTKIHDEDIVLSTVEPEKEDCTFIGWSNDPYAEYVEYYAEDTFTKNADTVLYAIWEEIIEEDEDDKEADDDKNQSQKEIPFEDVPEGAWYRKDVENAYKNGLINGKSEKRYAPNDNMTYAEAIKLACTIYQLYYDGEVTLTNGSDVWYSTYMDYALENRIVRTDYSSVANEYVTRKEFVNIFYGALPLKEFAKINNVEDNIIPDVKIGDAYSGEIYTFYRAGILTGNDAKGTFKPDSNISRSEVAAIVTRMLDSGARKEINF